MSPRLRSGQRGAIGLMAAGTLAVALVFMLLTVDSGRLYLEKRKLQGVADMAALEAVGRKGDCLPVSLPLTMSTAPAYASASALRNGFSVPSGNGLTVRCGTLATGANNLRVFSADATKKDAIQVTASRPVLTSIAGGVWGLFTGQAADLKTQLTATAVAAPKILPPQAQLTIRSTLVTVDSTQSDALNLVFGGLLGGTLKLDVAGWQGLVNTNINLLSYLNQLALDVKITAGNYNELLAKTVKVGQLLDAAVTVLKAGGDSANVAVSSIGSIKAIVGNLDVTLGSLLQLQTGAPAAGLNTNLNVFQLVEAFVQLANTKNGAAATVPVNIPGVLNASVKLRVIQPPQLSAIGNPTFAKDKTAATRIYVRTAQLQLGLTVGLPLLNSPVVLSVLNDLVAPLSDVLNNLLSLNIAGTVNSLLCTLGVTSCQVTNLAVLNSSSSPPAAKVDVVVELGAAESYVTGFTCASDATKTLITQTNASILKLKIGQNPQLSDSFNANISLDPVPPVPVVDIGAVTCKKPLLGIIGPMTCDLPGRKAFYGGGLGLSINADVGKDISSLGTHTFYQPPEINQPPQFYAAPTTNLVASLKGALQGVYFQVYKPTGTNVLGALLQGTGTVLNDLNGSMGSLIGNVLSPIVDPIVNALISTLGINLNKVEVGANLSCKPYGQATLVI